MFDEINKRLPFYDVPNADLDCGTLWEAIIGPVPDDIAFLAFALPQDFTQPVDISVNT